MKTVRRDWIMRQIDKGNIEAKCIYHYSDGYAWDAETSGGTDWLLARIRRPKFEPTVLSSGMLIERCTDPDYVYGCISFEKIDFKTGSGAAWWNEDGTITLLVHSNLCYTLRIKQA